jgi:hypothetical protein
MVFSSWWDGGPARLISLGGIEIALPDRASAMDLYSAGFASALVARENACVISLMPGYEYERSTSGSLASAAGNSGLNYERGNFFTLWITPDDAVCVTPGYLNNYYSSDGLDITSSSNFGALKIDYSRSVQSQRGLEFCQVL